MIDRLLKIDINKLKKKHPRLLCVHASNSTTSNTYSLWKMVKEKLKDIDIKEINIRNGEIYDCIGCPFETCMHYSEEGTCFYGGVIVDEVYPAAEFAMLETANNKGEIFKVSGIKNRIENYAEKIESYLKA